MYYEILIFCILGIVTGFFAGLLGIGGGILVVPCLTIIFSHLGFDKNLIIKYAIATSLGIMIFTAVSSFCTHMKKQNVKIDIIKKMILGIALGTICGSYFDHFINEKYLRALFGVYLFLIAIKMIIGFKQKKHIKKTPRSFLFIIGTLIGLKSGILGVGGGSISVPFFRCLGIPIRKAAGTSSGITLVISIIGSVSFALFGKHLMQSHEYFLGYIYMPALFSTGIFTLIFANIGARLTHRVSSKSLQIIFGAILFFLSFRIFFDLIIL